MNDKMRWACDLRGTLDPEALPQLLEDLKSGDEELIAAVMEFIPNLGPILALIPAVLVAFFQGSSLLPLSNLWFAVLVFGLYLVIQQVEGNLILPRVMGRSLNLHPLVVLIGIIVGSSITELISRFDFE